MNIKDIKFIIPNVKMCIASQLFFKAKIAFMS